MWFRDRSRVSLARRITVDLSVGLVLMLFLSFFGLHAVVRHEIYSMLESDLVLHLQSLAEFAAANPGRESEVELLIEFRSAAHQDFFQIWDSRGRTLARSASSLGRDLPRPTGDELAGPTAYVVLLPDEHRGLAKATVTRLPARDLRGDLTIVVAKETDAIERLERRLHWVMALVATATLLAGLVAVRYAVRRGLKPVQRLAQQIAQIDPRAPHRVALATGPLPDELEPLAEKTLSILDRLLAALERERRFSRNVAHELRTPLAEVRMLADVGAMAQTTGEAQASLVEIGATAAELQRVVDSLLTLARYEAGTEKPQTEPVDLVSAIRREIDRAAPAAGQRGLTIQSRLPQEYWILADATLLRRLIANLVGNAVAHAPVGSLVSIALQSDGSLLVANPAPHLEAGDMSRLGERFFRVDSGDRGTHAGLGLSLSEAIAGVLGLRLELQLDGSRTLVAALSGFKRLDG